MSCRQLTVSTFSSILFVSLCLVSCCRGLSFLVFPLFFFLVFHDLCEELSFFPPLFSELQAGFWGPTQPTLRIICHLTNGKAKKTSMEHNDEDHEQATSRPRDKLTHQGGKIRRAQIKSLPYLARERVQRNTWTTVHTASFEHFILRIPWQVANRVLGIFVSIRS